MKNKNIFLNILQQWMWMRQLTKLILKERKIQNGQKQVIRGSWKSNDLRKMANVILFYIIEVKKNKKTENIYCSPYIFH